ncbi:MAG TPA: GNAT family N-acetyltransferase [Marinobacterium sp.]|nr:GNAT family N-acetyltransferase [Marinobacterium sp.]
MKLEQYQIRNEPGIISLVNPNTTLGFVRFNENAEIEYIFVRRHYRRQGLGRMLVKMVEEQTGKSVRPLEPISPLGALLFDVVKEGA